MFFSYLFPSSDLHSTKTPREELDLFQAYIPRLLFPCRAGGRRCGGSGLARGAPGGWARAGPRASLAWGGMAGLAPPISLIKPQRRRCCSSSSPLLCDPGFSSSHVWQNNLLKPRMEHHHESRHWWDAPAPADASPTSRAHHRKL